MGCNLVGIVEFIPLIHTPIAASDRTARAVAKFRHYETLYPATESKKRLFEVGRMYGYMYVI